MAEQQYGPGDLNYLKNLATKGSQMIQSYGDPEFEEVIQGMEEAHGTANPYGMILERYDNPPIEQDVLGMINELAFYFEALIMEEEIPEDIFQELEAAAKRLPEILEGQKSRI